MSFSLSANGQPASSSSQQKERGRFLFSLRFMMHKHLRRFDSLPSVYVDINRLGGGTYEPSKKKPKEPCPPYLGFFVFVICLGILLVLSAGPGSGSAGPKIMGNSSIPDESTGGAWPKITAAIDNRPKVLGLVGVHSSFRSDSADRRAALRSTWFPSNPQKSDRLQKRLNLVFKFVIGRTDDAQKMAEVQKEQNEYNDFMFIDIEEGYFSRSYKTLAFFKEALKLFDAEYYIKADDDIYLRPDRLVPLLTIERTNQLNYIGCMNKENLGRNKELLYAHGQIYILSEKVVQPLADAKNDSLTMSKYEDVSVGYWMLALGVQYEDVRALCDPRCSPTSIAVWDISRCSGLCDPVNKMKELDKISMCSGKAGI